MKHVSLTPSTAYAGDRVGSFRYFSADDRWEWSDTVARIHGYGPGEVKPDTTIVMSHKHPHDASAVAALIERMTGHGEPFSSRHRIIDTAGVTHMVLVVGERMVDATGAVIGSSGFYVDITDFDPGPQEETAFADFKAQRISIEQAKGMLMAVYQISADRAFEILAWRSQETNVKLRDLAAQLVKELGSGILVVSDLREKADQVLLTAHRRISVKSSRSQGPSAP